MPENESSSEEKHPESQRPGSAGEFISLNQACRIALDQARENRDFYGRRYRRQDLTWEVVSLVEREETYNVRLSYRPARGFRGQAGVEEFNIDRQGSVQARRMVSEPVRRRKFPGCGLLAAGVAVLVLVSAMRLVASAL